MPKVTPYYDDPIDLYGEIAKGDIVECVHPDSIYRHKVLYDDGGFIFHNSDEARKVVREYFTEEPWYGECRVRINNSLDNKYTPFGPEDIIKRAKSKLGKAFRLEEYNCEHFVNECRYGVFYSEQVEEWTKRGIDPTREAENPELWAGNRELTEVKADALEILSECIAGMNIAMQSPQHLTPNNKWILAEDEYYLNILDSDGLVVEKYITGMNPVHSVRAKMSVPKLDFNAKKAYIAFYFEVKILHGVTDNKKIRIGFCDKKFPLIGTYIGNQYSSIGIGNKNGMRVNGEFKHFEWHGRQFGAVIGVGLIHSPADSSLKAFASSDGGFLGSIELPAQFCYLELYPAASLFYENDRVEANFGKTEWAFDP